MATLFYFIFQGFCTLKYFLCRVRDRFVTKYLIWRFFKRSSLMVDSPRENMIIFSFSWLKLLCPTTLGWRKICANTVSNYSWLDFLCKQYIQLLLIENHTRLFLDEIITFNYSWLKLLHPATLGWKKNCADIAFSYSWLKTNIWKQCIKLLLVRNIIFSCSWMELSYSTTLGWSYCIQLLLVESKTVRI